MIMREVSAQCDILVTFPHSTHRFVAFVVHPMEIFTFQTKNSQQKYRYLIRGYIK